VTRLAKASTFADRCCARAVDWGCNMLDWCRTELRGRETYTLAQVAHGLAYPLVSGRQHDGLPVMDKLARHAEGGPLGCHGVVAGDVADGGKVKPG
jgi:hypothetical protein